MTRYLDVVNQAINYIEHNLDSLLTVKGVAATVGYSRFHLVRFFHSLTGETIQSYIRKRRLHEVARELLTTQKAILDIALDYQFQSHEAFSRSFKRAYRSNPSTYRARGRYRHYFPRLTLSRPILFTPPLQTRLIVPARPFFILTHHSSDSLIYRKPDRIQLYFW